MPTTHLFAVTVGRIFKQVATSNELGTTTQRVKAARGALSTRLGQRKVRRQMHLPRIRDRWLLASIGIAVVISIVFTWYSFQHYDILLFADAFSHMRISRGVIDSLTPGFGQLGSLWLPLPHLIMLPFIWNDFLYQTGLAGSIPSMICYVAASLYLFLAARRLTKNSFASFVGTLVFQLNPNVIYLQTTPLTEPVCFATFAAAGFYFVAWAQEDKVKYLVLAAAATFLATLARYDGWILFVSMFVLVIAIGVARRHPLKQMIANCFLFGTLASFGIMLWLAWNKIIFGDPLKFQHGVYSSLVQMQYFYGTELAIVTHNLWPSIRYYVLGCLDTLFPVISILALVALAKFVIRRRGIPEMLGALSFLAPLSFYAISFYTGQVTMLVPGDSSQLFNTRFGSEAVLPAALFIATLFSTGIKLPKPWMYAALNFILAFVIISQSVIIMTNGVITLEEGQYGDSCSSSDVIDIYLGQHYNGGLILEDIYLGSPNETQEVGIHLDRIIYQGSGDLWKRALKNPGAVVDWVLIGERSPESPYPIKVNTTSPLFTSQFTLVSHGQGFDLYLRNDLLHSIPARPIPTKLLVDHQYCGTGKRPPKGGW